MMFFCNINNRGIILWFRLVFHFLLRGIKLHLSFLLAIMTLDVLQSILILIFFWTLKLVYLSPVDCIDLFGRNLWHQALSLNLLVNIKTLQSQLVRVKSWSHFFTRTKSLGHKSWSWQGSRKNIMIINLSMQNLPLGMNMCSLRSIKFLLNSSRVVFEQCTFCAECEHMLRQIWLAGQWLCHI